jgi:hypothetical protein
MYFGDTYSRYLNPSALEPFGPGQRVSQIRFPRCSGLTKIWLYLDTSTPFLSPLVADFLLDIQMIDPHGKLDPL